MSFGKKLTLIGLAVIATITTYASPTTTLTSSAKLVGTCQLSATNVNFGTIDPTTGHTSTGQLSVLCSKNVTYSVAMNFPANGQGNSQGIYFSGIMKGANPNNPDFVNYNIFYPNDDSVIWGSGNIAGSSASSGYTIKTVTGTGSGTLQTYPIKVLESTELSTGQVNTYITADTYSDNVTASITY